MGAIRINITLPEDVIKLLNKKVKSGEKSAFIAQAIRSYVKKESQAEMIKRMIEGYQAASHLEQEDHDWLDADLGAPKNGY